MDCSNIRLVKTQSMIAVVTSISPTSIVLIPNNATSVRIVLLLAYASMVNAQKKREKTTETRPGAP